MNRVFKTRYFCRWMRKTELTVDALCAAVSEMARGLIDADLGGGIVKKRVGLAGRGKRGGARTLVATNKGNRWFFVFGFEKNARANISNEEKEALQELGKRRFNPFVVSLSNHDRIKSITINWYRQPFDKLRANG